MSSYPSSIYSPRTRENKAGIEYDPDKKTEFFAEDINNSDDEIVAIETELGTNPKGSYDDVKDRLDDYGGRLDDLEGRLHCLDFFITTKVIDV